MSEQGGPEAWQKLWSMWMPSATDAPGGAMPGADAGSLWPQGAASPFPPMPAGFPDALSGAFPGAFPQSLAGAIPGLPTGFPGFPGAPGSAPGAAAAFPFGGLNAWGPMAALAAMTPGAAGMPGTAAGASTPSDPLAAVFNAPFAGLSPSLSMMSEMIAPLTQVDELDKRIADLRAVEHWLKLNLQMLQSTTQALEVQRATLATLRAFGAASAAVGEAAAKSMREGPGASGAASTSDASAEAAGEAMAASLGAGMAAVPALDPQRWWAMLNDQFQQMAAAAASVAPSDGKTTAPAGTAPAQATRTPASASEAGAASTAKRGEAAPSRSAAGRTSTTAKQPTKPVSKRAAPRPATVSKTAKGASSSTASGGRATGARASVGRKPRASTDA
ncbi:PhaM family polyhydroxyalkanoate granule multifunctional regulatory protein [Robbsia sp. KACC 23696]|uniref:PhaM family polyhydroxyalkanoate granule multifunctional regulatory protein n=1 Tax=Robbsia sp. KACC 23696 TaxID=3149231 RepID=UPI00325A530A